MKVKVIATGSSKWDRFTGRWGVSFLVGEDLLFDSFGDAKAFFGNMRKFGVDISKINTSYYHMTTGIIFREPGI